MIDEITKPSIDPDLTNEQLLADYRLAYISRQVSLIGRREVLSGKAKFGIFGDGKEIAQVALAHYVQPGDFRSGYYRDQTLMMALGLATVQQLFAQLYAHPDLAADPWTAGRSMNAHFATRSIDGSGQWRNLMNSPNTSADMSPTGSQMPRLVGLGYASRLYRELESLQHLTQFSHHGNEIAIGTIGNASCAEGMFWEAVNAIGVLRAPVVLSIWDDGYGISVTNEHQITKQDLSQVLSGFQREADSREGFDIYSVKGWDYAALRDVYRRATTTARRDHVPAIVHVTDVTQPQGHSTSGSHERYKSTERLAWEDEYDGLRQMRLWLIESGAANAADLEAMEEAARREVESIRRTAWEAFLAPVRAEVQAASNLLDQLSISSVHATQIQKIKQQLQRIQHPIRKDIMVAAHRALLLVRREDTPARRQLITWKEALSTATQTRYSSHVYSETALAARHVPAVPAVFSELSPKVRGFEILNAGFDAMLARDPRVVFFGEDVGKLGGVNQALAGLQNKYGELRVADTGIRETTIIGQAIGLAMRGLRPVAEIQYLDYLLYALQIMSDDLATLHWRTRGGQKAPVIVRTRGHRLEGIWHTGSPMASLVHLLRGMHILVPRNMTQAAGFYNTLLHGDEPGLVVEVLNGYRLRERLPDNIGEFTVPLGVPEVLRPGRDITIVTYGALCRITLEAATMLQEAGIDAEVIDVQSLLPFDTEARILESLKKTNRILFVDEDVPGGATAYMLQQVIEKQGGYHWLDSEPVTLTAQEHRGAYGSDGDYWSKPNTEQIFTAVYELMNEVDPAAYPIFYR